MKKIFLAFLSICVLHTSSDAADKIRVGYPAPVGNFLTLPLAQNRGFFKEEGHDAEIVRIRPPASYAALVNGDIDYYTGIAELRLRPQPEEFRLELWPALYLPFHLC